MKDMNLGLEEFLRVRVGFAPHMECKYKGHCEGAFPEDRVATYPYRRKQSTLPVLRSFLKQEAVELDR